ncbi:hypothetical protein Tco_0199509 [Tanacetum coccineum]
MTCGTELTDEVCLQTVVLIRILRQYFQLFRLLSQPVVLRVPLRSHVEVLISDIPCPSFVPDPCYNRNFDCFPHDSQTLPQQYQTPPVASMEMLHAQTDLIGAMQDFLKKYDHIPYNERASKTLNQIQKDQEEKSIAELLAEERLQKANQALNESQSPQEMRIQDLEIQKASSLKFGKSYKKQKSLESLKLELEVGRLSLTMMTMIWDFMRFIRIRFTLPFRITEPKDSLIMGDGHINTTPETETISVETLVSNPSESDDFSLGECNLFDIDDSYYEKSTSRLAHLAPISPEIVEACVDDDDTDDDDDYDDDFYDCVDIEEDGGEIDLDISKIVDISLREKLVESYLLIEKINTFNLSPPIPISPIICPSSTIPVVDLDLPLEEADVPSFSDDSMILSEYESFTFDDEPVMAEVNVFDEINTSELSYPGIGENVVLDEEEDTFTFAIRSFLPFVTYPEVLPASYSTGSEDKIFKPGIFDNVLTRKSSLTLDVFDPLHPPLMDFNVTKALSGFTFSLLQIFSNKFFEPGIKNAKVFRILEDSWFNIVEEQSNAHNFH